MTALAEAAAFTPNSVLLTGGAGFIGSHVLEHLVIKYPSVQFVCIDSLEYCATKNNLKAVWNCHNFVFVRGDITSADLINYLIEQHRIDVIINFAAQSHVDNSFGNSFSFSQTNVIGTHVLLDCARKHFTSIRRFIHVSTDEVYGESSLDTDATVFSEDSPLNPSNPYAATKAASDLLVRAYHTSFKLPVIITRGNNVYGPRQYPEKLIPKFISLLLREKPCTVHGDGVNRRSFIYISDAVAAFDTILHHGVIGHVYNIGTDFEISNLDVARKLINILDIPEPHENYISFVDDRDYNDCRYRIRHDALKSFGWSPQVSFEDGLHRTITWYKLHCADHWEGGIEHALEAHSRLGSTSSRPQNYCELSSNSP